MEAAKGSHGRELIFLVKTESFCITFIYAVIISLAHARSALYHSTSFSTPARILNCGSQPSTSPALVTSAQLVNISAGLGGPYWTSAFFPTTSSINLIRLLIVMTSC